MGVSLKRDILWAIIITVAAMAVGIGTNIARTPLLLALVSQGKIHPTQANTYKGVRIIDDWGHGGWERVKESSGGEEKRGIRWIEYYQVMEFNRTGEARFIDARILKEYNEGHIPGAIPWPFNEFLEYLNKYHDEIPFDTPVIVYCEGGNCDQSKALAEDLQIVGYKEIYIYFGGFDEWVNMGMPVKRGGSE